MIYRENGQFKTTYAADQPIFPIAQDRLAMLGLLALAFIVVPLLATEYLFRAVLIPIVILSLAAIGLNVLMGYCGQISLGSGAFMAVGAYARLQPRVRMPFLIPLVVHPAGRLVATAIGVAVRRAQPAHQGLLSRLRHAGGAVLRRLGVPAHQVDHQLHAVGSVNAPPIQLFGFDCHRRRRLPLRALLHPGAGAGDQEPGARPCRPAMDGDPRHGYRRRDHRREADVRQAHRLRRLVLPDRRIGRDVGVPLSRLLGARGFLDRPLLPAHVHGDHRRAGVDPGQLLGAIFIVLLPIFLNQALPPLGAVVGWKISTATVSHFESMIFGALIVFFLVVEPHGLARLWSVAKEKLRLWPFPHEGEKLGSRKISHNKEETVS